MNRKIHNQFLEIAKEISPKLSIAISTVGPVKFSKDNKSPLVETLFRAVAGQQLSTKAAATIWGRVVDSAKGKPLEKHIAKVSHEALRECGLSNSKSKAMKSIVEAYDSGLLEVSELKKMNHSQRSDQLTTIWGVGQWTADMIGIFYFGDKDVWPNGDLAVWKTLERLTSKQRNTVRTAELFSPLRTYLALYMYKIANAGI